MNRFIGAAGTTTRRTEGERLFSVRLVDRRTGEVPSVNGIPLSVLTHAPQKTVAEFMDGRDRHIWRAEIEQLGTGEEGATTGARIGEAGRALNSRRI